ncbi:MAG: ferritin family protein [Myxococcota bacterium]
MSNNFNADEIFEIAEQIERNGAKFYRRAAEVFKEKNADASKLLVDLAKMEEDHERIFARMRRELSGDEGVIDAEEEVVSYLHAIADSKIFDLKLELTSFWTGKETIDDIIKKAIGVEKDSIIFYTGMRDVVPEAWGREKLNRIIGEEMRHIGILLNIKERFAEKGK